MIAEALLCLLASPVDVPCSSDIHVAVVQDETDVDQAIDAAGDDIGKLIALAEQYDKARNAKAAKQVYQRVIELDPDHEAARAALRHQKYDGRWFESFVALAKYKREKIASMMEKGMAPFGDEWVPYEDLPYLQMGWVRDEAGNWADPQHLQHLRQVEEWKAAGYQFRADDNSWVAPDEIENWTKMLWKCGDDWVDLDQANAYHSKLDQCWELAGQHFITWTTAEWTTGNYARWHADQTYAHLVRIFGVEPDQPPYFFVHPNLASYNDAVGGNVTLPESEGFSSFHGAYFADGCFDFSPETPGYFGMGVAYWDRRDPALNAWGPFWTRWAAAQSYVDAIDRSWYAIGEPLEKKTLTNLQVFGADFWKEKRIPRWLRYGAASYVERFLPNPETPAGEDPWGLRTFAFDEVKKGGGLRKLKDVFAFGLDVTNIPDSSLLYHEAGVVVAYLLDGAQDASEVQDAHAAFRTALASGSNEDIRAAAKALETALLAKDKEIRAFAGL